VTPEEAAAHPETTVAESEAAAVPEAFWRTQIAFLENRMDWEKERIEYAKTQIAEAKHMKEFCEAQLARVTGAK
jgi:hypothetical protein